MRPLYCLTIILFFLPEVVLAQFDFSASFGYGTYSMKELKEHQKGIQTQFPVETKITSSFPGYWYYEAGTNYRFKFNFFVGATIAYGSTGGKINYQDYSGEIDCEHKLRYIAVGLPLGYILPLKAGKMNLQFELSPSVYFGDMELEVAAEINKQREAQSEEFKSTNIGLRPSIRLERKTGPVRIFIQAGYYLDVYRSNLTVKDNSEYYLLNNQDEAVHTNFSGLRTAIGVSYGLK